MGNAGADLVGSLVGRVLGQYAVESLLGQGGMATVLRARQLNLEREVALKVLPPDRSRDPAQVRRFIAEARAAARLDHPAIVPVYDVGEDAGVAFIAMRLIDGPTLAEVIPRGGLPLDRIDSIVRQLASALDYIHGQGLIHRDVTASNVMLEPGDRVTLTDFGIAATGRPTEGTVIEGTAEYLAPELARGLPASPRSDVYALGVLTYEMVAGHLPFTGPDARSVLRQQVNTAPPPLTRLRPGLTPRVERAVFTALAKEPAQRYPSAGAFAAALRGAMAAVGSELTATIPMSQRMTARLPPAMPPSWPVRASAPAAPPRPRAASPRRRSAIGAAALVLIAFLAFAGLAAVFVLNRAGTGAAGVVSTAGASTAAPSPQTTATAPATAHATAIPTTTMLRQPTPTVTRTATAPRAQAVQAPTPASAIQGYYNALLAKNDALAYSYWSPSLRAHLSYQTGLVDPELPIRTFRYQFTVPPPQGNLATARVIRDNQLANGTVRVIIDWQLVRGPQGWRLDQIHQTRVVSATGGSRSSGKAKRDN